MKTPLKRFPPLLAFFAVCLLSGGLVWLGLRLYFSESRLAEHLTQSFSGAQWQILSGQADSTDGSLRVTSTAPQGKSDVQLLALNIKPQYYEYLTLHFARKHSSQPLLLRVFQQGQTEPAEQAILYTNNFVSRFDMRTLVPSKHTITGLSLQTNGLIEPYQLATVEFLPKSLNSLEFAQLLWESLAPEKPSVSTDARLVAPMLLLLLYLIAVGLFFALYLWLAGRSIIDAWWVALVAAWLTVDVPYLWQKTQRAIATYENFQASDAINAGFGLTLFLWLVVLLSAWALGFVLVRACVKQRYGYMIFALGVGYVLGLLVLMLLPAVYVSLQRPLVMTEVLLGLWALAIPISIFLPAKRCTIEELRLEKAASNTTYVMVLVILLLFLYRLGLSGIENLLASPVAQVSSANTLLTVFMMLNPDSGSLPLRLSAFGLLELLASIALFCTVIGGLRYLSAKLLPAVLIAYAVISLPVFDTAISLGSLRGQIAQDTVSVTMALLALMMAFVALSIYKEWRLLVLSLSLSALIYLVQDWVWLAVVMIAVSLVGRLFGGALSTLLLLAGAVAIVLFNEHLSPRFMPLTSVVIDTEHIADQTITDVLCRWFFQGDLHFLLLAAVGSIIVMLLFRRSRDRLGLEMLLVAGVTGLLLTLLAIVLPASTAHSVMLIVAPLVMMIPVCVYHLITTDDDTLPLI